ncbi:alpha/beta hydrolase [Hoeflea sp.]|uniref:alpha/beta hydrolase n=1 Tax=Hoeflea sp. TaxID=1940281 RepID=UPI003B01BCC0
MKIAMISALPVPRLFLIFILLPILAAGCVNDPAVFNKKPVSVSQVAAVKTVFAATSRKASDDPALMFSAERSKALSYVQLDVGIPEAHKPGKVESSTKEPDPSKHFTLVNRRRIDNQAALRSNINQQLGTLPDGERELFVFVHGFNNSFPSGIFRQTQMLADFGANVVALNYSWPSASRPEGYVYDRDSAIFAQDGLVEVLRLAVSTDADHVTVFAHSMGSLVTVQALRSLVISDGRETLNAIDTVVLAAPDVDIDVFDSVITDIGRDRPQEFAVLVSDNDRALQLSSKLRGGHPRVGQSETAEFLQERGIVVLDVSKLDGGGHSTFAGSQALIDMVRSDALRQTLNSAEQNDQTATVVNNAGDAASLLILLPTRMLSSIAGDGSQAPNRTEK